MRANSYRGGDRSLLSRELTATPLLEDSEEACVGSVDIAWPQLPAAVSSVVMQLLDLLSKPDSELESDPEISLGLVEASAML